MVTAPGSQSVVIELDQPPAYEVTQTTGLRSNQVVSDNNLTHNKCINGEHFFFCM